MDKPIRVKTKNQNNKPRHTMKNTIIKSIAAVLLMAGITSAQAADKGVIDRAKDKVREVVKEINKPVRPVRTPTAVAAVRG